MPRIIGIPLADSTRDTANTGGITYIKRHESTISDERYEYIITGNLLPPMTRRKNFQGSGRYFQRQELGLSEEWELAHLWPPRFGDEAAAGIMWATQEMNQQMQNHCVEPWLQSLRRLYPGAQIEITATAASWCPNYLRSRGNPDYKGAEFLKRVSYEVTNCPRGTQGPAGGPLLGTSISMQMKPLSPGILPDKVHIQADHLLSWQ